MNGSLFDIEDKVNLQNEMNLKKWRKHFEVFEYNDEQRLFIESPLECSKLIGIPGGGKSQSLLGKIIHHYLLGDFTNSNQYLIISFSRKTCVQLLERGITFLEVENDDYEQNEIYFNKKNIRTIHSLAKKIQYEKYGEEMNTSEDTVIISSILDIDNDPNFLNNIDEFTNLKVIFVDEAQDLSSIQYEFISCLSHYLSIPVIMIGDPNQNIYQFQKGSDTFLLNHPGPSYFLIKNYRSSQPNINLMNYFKPWKQITPHMVSGRHFNDNQLIKPVIFTGTMDEIMEDVIKNIKTSVYPKENIAIIGPVKKSKPYSDNNYSNIGLSLFGEYFGKERIEYKKHYDEISDEYMETNKEEGHINLYTIHGSKGLEFDEVYLINFHTNTYGIMPTEEKYREYKYLWYVGLSRVKYKMRIYILQNRVPWYELNLCPANYYKIENKRFNFSKPLVFQSDQDPEFFRMKDLFANKTYFDEKVYYMFEKLLVYKVYKSKIIEYPFDVKTNVVKNYNTYNKLYQLFLLNIFNYFYDMWRGNISTFIKNIEEIHVKLVCLPKKYIKGYKVFKTRWPNMGIDVYKFRDIYEMKNKMNSDEELILTYLYELFEKDMEREFLLVINNELYEYPKQEIDDGLLFLKIFSLKRDQFLTDEDLNSIKYVVQIIFKLSIFMYQFDNEIRLWDNDFTDELIDLKPYIESIIEYTKNLEEDGYEFSKNSEHKFLPLLTTIPIVNNKKVIHTKFGKIVNKKNIIEAIIDSNFVDISWDNPEIEIWNFYTGEKYRVELKIDKNSYYQFLIHMSQTIKKRLKNMIFIYEIEIMNTGNIEPEIVQRHFEEMNTGIVISEGYLYPKHIENVRNYYDNHLLYTSSDDIYKLKQEIDDILTLCDKPLFISNYVEAYDREILNRSNILTDQTKYYIIDTTNLFVHNVGNMVYDMDTWELYNSVFKKKLDEKKCKNNVKMLKELLIHYKYMDENLLNLVY